MLERPCLLERGKGARCKDALLLREGQGARCKRPFPLERGKPCLILRYHDVTEYVRRLMVELGHLVPLQAYLFMHNVYRLICVIAS